jgi:nicotinamide-nucleotide amidase
MRAAIIAVGSELLGTDRLDTNSLIIARLLEAYGFTLERKAVVPDNREAIVQELIHALQEHEVVLITGGLGPTEDDLTREAVAQAMSLHLELDASILAHIEQRFTSRGMRMPEVNRKQAMVFAGQRTLTNPRGTAPGFHLNLSYNGKARHLWIFPGVPYELEGMLETDLEPWLQKQRRPLQYRRIVKLTGITESGVEEKLKPFYAKYTGEPITILASRGEIQVHLFVRGNPDEAYSRLNQMEQELCELFGDRIFGLDNDSLESVVGLLLASRGETVATGESCTGGLLASRITDVSGSSAYFLGGVVAYSRESKLFLLGVDPALIEKHGEVSEEVARELAIGARRRFSATYGVGITGIAGPTGGSEQKPVGTVHIAVCRQAGTDHRKLQLSGSRELIKLWATQQALNMLRLMIQRT